MGDSLGCSPFLLGDICMAKFKDLTGMTFSEWTVLERAEDGKSKNVRWLCRCSCGTERTLSKQSLLLNKSKSCGCLDDLTDKVFGEWTSLYRVDNDKNNNVRWLCKCSCGTEKVVDKYSLVNGRTKSCGCLRNIYIEDGSIFGRWKVLHKVEDKHDSAYLCRCECGSEYIVKGSTLTLGKSKGCQRCSLLGENNPRWNPNLSDDDRMINRNYPEYIQWRNEVFNRDSYTCQVCNKHGGTLNAHHIESFSDNPELRTALSNGITLCEECHKNFHHQYGYGNNTKAQLNEFSKVCN